MRFWFQNTKRDASKIKNQSQKRSRYNCEAGATQTEHSVLIGLISVIALAVVVGFGEQVTDIYCNNNGKLGEMGQGFDATWGYDPEQKCCAWYVEEMGSGGWECIPS